MNRLAPTLVILLVVAFVFFLMWNAWRKRTKAATSVELEQSAPADAELFFSLARVFYVATTRTATPLERVSLPGLRYRGYAQLHAFDSGVQVQVRGEHPAFIPSRSILSVQQQQLIIDKVTEQDGLMALIWMFESESYSTVFRLTGAEERAKFAQLAHIYSSDSLQNNTLTTSTNFTTGTESTNNA